MYVRKNRRANTIYEKKYEIVLYSRGGPHDDCNLAVIQADIEAGDPYVGGIRALGSKPIRAQQAIEHLKALGCAPHVLGLETAMTLEEAEDAAVVNEVINYPKPRGQN